MRAIEIISDIHEQLYKLKVLGYEPNAIFINSIDYNILVKYLMNLSDYRDDSICLGRFLGMEVVLLANTNRKVKVGYILP